MGQDPHPDVLLVVAFAVSSGPGGRSVRASTEPPPQPTASGFRSVHPFPLRLRGEVIGAMNIFGTDVGGLDAAESLDTTAEMASANGP